MEFEPTRSIQGIFRVMVRTHLNRNGIGFVSRSEGDLRNSKGKTLSPRVLGPFDDNCNPVQLSEWSALLDAWLLYADRCPYPQLFNNEDPRSIEKLKSIDPKVYYNAKEWKNKYDIHNNWANLALGVYDGLNYLNQFYEFDPHRLWSRIDSASQSYEGVDKLIEEVETNIRGYGSTLAGSFLADLGSAQFIKTDAHVMDSVAELLKVRSVTKQTAFSVVRELAHRHTLSPRAMDKMMYLGCSGNWYLVGREHKGQQAAKKEFLNILGTANL